MDILHGAVDGVNNRQQNLFTHKKIIMRNQTKTRVSPDTMLAYIIGSLVIAALFVAAVIAIVNICSGNVHLANGQL